MNAKEPLRDVSSRAPRRNVKTSRSKKRINNFIRNSLFRTRNSILTRPEVRRVWKNLYLVDCISFFSFIHVASSQIIDDCQKFIRSTMETLIIVRHAHNSSQCARPIDGRSDRLFCIDKATSNTRESIKKIISIAAVRWEIFVFVFVIKLWEQQSDGSGLSDNRGIVVFIKSTELCLWPDNDDAMERNDECKSKRLHLHLNDQQ